MNGDGGGGTQNAGGNTGVIDARTGIPVVYSTNTTTEAANRTYAVPTYMAMTATSAGEASVGYEGTASDGLTQLDAAHALTPTTSAADGHIVATENVTPQRGPRRVHPRARVRPLAAAGGRHRHRLAARALPLHRAGLREHLERLRPDAQPAAALGPRAVRSRRSAGPTTSTPTC